MLQHRNEKQVKAEVETHLAVGRIGAARVAANNAQARSQISGEFYLELIRLIEVKQKTVNG